MRHFQSADSLSFTILSLLLKHRLSGFVLQNQSLNLTLALAKLMKELRFVTRVVTKLGG